MLFLTYFYQTAWFYIMTLLLVLFGLYGIIKWRSWKLKKENRQLEEIIERRTKEINDKNFELKKQNFILKKQLEQLKMLFEARSHLKLEDKKEGIVKDLNDKKFLSDIQNIINANLADPEFNVDQLSRKLHMSHATLYRKIHALTGETPTDFIRSCRLQRGAELLKRGMGSVLEVALEVGFSSANYFSKCFKKKFHQLPSEYQLPKAS